MVDEEHIGAALHEGTVPKGVKGARPRAADGQYDCTHEHGPVGAGGVHHGPEAVRVQLADAKRPETMPQEDGDFRCNKGARHDEDERHGRPSCIQANKQEHPAGHLHRPDPKPEKLGGGEANFREATRAADGRKQEFLQPFGDEDDPHHEANQG